MYFGGPHVIVLFGGGVALWRGRGSPMSQALPYSSRVYAASLSKDALLN